MASFVVRQSSSPRRQPTRTLTLALVCVLLCAATCGVGANYITQTTFPFEGCKQDPRLSLYSASLLSYDISNDALGNAVGSVTCFLIDVKDQAQCRRDNKFPNNKTHCCDVGFNKFKLYPNQGCQASVRAVNVKLASAASFRGASMTYQNMGGEYQNQWVHKITPLALNPTTAKGTIICITLGFPCPTLEAYANDPNTLEYNLYSVKDTYECCPAGATPVPLEPFNFAPNLVLPQVARAPPPKGRASPPKASPKAVTTSPKLSGR